MEKDQMRCFFGQDLQDKQDDVGFAGSAIEY